MIITFYWCTSFNFCFRIWNQRKILHFFAPILTYLKRKVVKIYCLFFKVLYTPHFYGFVSVGRRGGGRKIFSNFPHFLRCLLQYVHLFFYILSMDGKYLYICTERYYIVYCTVHVCSTVYSELLYSTCTLYNIFLQCTELCARVLHAHIYSLWGYIIDLV